MASLAVSDKHLFGRYQTLLNQSLNGASIGSLSIRSSQDKTPGRYIVMFYTRPKMLLTCEFSGVPCIKVIQANPNGSFECNKPKHVCKKKSDCGDDRCRAVYEIYKSKFASLQEFLASHVCPKEDDSFECADPKCLVIFNSYRWKFSNFEEFLKYHDADLSKCPVETIPDSLKPPPLVRVHKPLPNLPAVCQAVVKSVCDSKGASLKPDILTADVIDHSILADKRWFFSGGEADAQKELRYRPDHFLIINNIQPNKYPYIYPYMLCVHDRTAAENKKFWCIPFNIKDGYIYISDNNLSLTFSGLLDHLFQRDNFKPYKGSYTARD